MKRMNNLKNVIAAKIMGGLVIGMTAVAGVAPVTVFAQSQEAECICEEKCSQDSTNEECAVCLYDYNVCQGVDAHAEGSEECTETAEESYGPLTPDGNMNLVDDYGSIEAGGKQFITVTTKSGNYFYIIIDHDDKGTETVHFLNLVDESDLLKLMEDDDVESYMNSQGMTASEKETEEVKSTEATEEISEEPKEETKAPIEDGTYTAEFKTDSSMFHVNDAYDDKGTLTVKDGKMTGEVLSVLFKGVHYEIMVETVPGTSVTVNMRVIRNHDVTSEDGSEKISANNFYVDVEDVENLDDKEIVALSNAQAWETETDEYISIANIEYELEAKEGQYPVTFSTSNGTSIERTIFVVNQPFVKNEKANEGVMAFNFFKTVDEITESQALDTDLKTWANAQGWKLTDEDQSVDISVDYDFDPEEVTEGVYEITFSTTGREFKIHTTDYSEEGQEVGLTFFPEDIHVMPKVVF